MKQQLISILSCPCCGSSLRLEIGYRTGKRIRDGQLACKECNAIFPIVNDIACFNKPSLEGATSQRIKKTLALFAKQELRKKWLAYFTKPELLALKNEWRWMAKHLPFKRNAWHLDWATGTGRFLRNIVSLTKGEIVVLEKDYPTCVGLRGLLRKLKKYSHVSIVCGDACNMPFVDNSFSSESSWHGLDEPHVERAIGESRRTLKANGVLAAIGLFFEKNSKSFRVAVESGVKFAGKGVALQCFLKAPFREVEQDVFFKGKWEERRSFLPKRGDFYASYVITGMK